MRKYITLALFVLSALLPAYSQQAQTSVPAAQDPSASAAAPASPSADNAQLSTIVFFREHHYTGSALKPSIFLDDKELERLVNGRWFSVSAAPGKHQIHSSAKNEPASIIETKPGETAYVQMVVVTGNWRGAGRLLQVDSAEAQNVIAKLKPLHD